MSESVLHGVFPQPERSLRDLVTSLLHQGFAWSVQPIASTTITTDDKGLVAGEVKIGTMTGAVPAYRAHPDKSGKFPVVLVVQEIFGVHEHIKDVCRRFAKAGYMAVAQELFARQGDVSKEKDFAKIFDIVSKVPDAQVISDLDACVAWAKSTGKLDGDKIGITGFCWGGRIVWLYAAHKPDLKAGVAWYGRLTGDKTPNQPAHPVDLAGRIKVPVLGLYGGADAGIPVSTIEDMKNALGTGTASSFHVYPDAPHAFFADYRPSYREAAANDGWQRLQTWFRQHGLA
jgi:carboxymethylenebutenolidase